MTVHDEANHARFLELVEEGKTAAEAILEIAIQNADQNMQEFYSRGTGEQESLSDELTNLYGQLLEHGYTEEVAAGLVDTKSKQINDLKHLRNTIRLGKLFPLSMIPNFKTLAVSDKERLLWAMGFDIRNYPYLIDIGCYYWKDKVECGEFIYGSERVDKDWCRTKHASDEARYFYDRDVLAVLRGNKKMET